MFFFIVPPSNGTNRSNISAGVPINSLHNVIRGRSATKCRLVILSRVPAGYTL